MNSSSRTLALRGDWVLVDEPGGPVMRPNLWISINGNSITDISEVRPADAEIVIDQAGTLILPGLLNLHHHCFSETMVRNQTEDWRLGPFEDKVVYGLLMPVSRASLQIASTEERLAIAKLGLLQLLKCGSTTVMEPFRNSIPEMFNAAMEIGLRYYGAPYLFSTGNLSLSSTGIVDYAKDDQSSGALSDLARWDELYQQYNGSAGDRVRVVLSPHATDTCGPELLAEVRRRALELDCPVTIHLAQSLAELRSIERDYSMSPVQYLKSVGLLDCNVLAAHCIHCTDYELQELRRNDITILNCPSTFARGGVRAIFSRFVQAGVRTVVCTDGYVHDIVTEIQRAGITSKLDLQMAGTATARDLLAAVTTEAAKALGRADLGRIAVGAKADIVGVDLGKLKFQPVLDPERAFVWGASGSDVNTVVVDGQVLVKEGQFQLADERSIISEGVAAVQRLWLDPEVRKIIDDQVRSN